MVYTPLPPPHAQGARESPPLHPRLTIINSKQQCLRPLLSPKVLTRSPRSLPYFPKITDRNFPLPSPRLKNALVDNIAWTTLLTNSKYLPGLLALDFSLKSVGSKYPLVVLYTDTLEADAHAALKARGVLKKRVEYLLPSAHKDFGSEVRFYDCWSAPSIPSLHPSSLLRRWS